MGRADGIKLKHTDVMYRIAAHVMAKRSDAQNAIELFIPQAPIKAYIQEKRREGTPVSHLAVFMAGFVRLFAEYPALNRFMTSSLSAALASTLPAPSAAASTLLVSPHPAAKTAVQAQSAQRNRLFDAFMFSPVKISPSIVRKNGEDYNSKDVFPPVGAGGKHAIPMAME